MWVSFPDALGSWSYQWGISKLLLNTKEVLRSFTHTLNYRLTYKTFSIICIRIMLTISVRGNLYFLSDYHFMSGRALFFNVFVWHYILFVRQFFLFMNFSNRIKLNLITLATQIIQFDINATHICSYENVLHLPPYRWSEPSRCLIKPHADQ